MLSHHEYLATVPFDLYDLTLFDLVASTGSFTKAATSAGLTQSAMTRRIGRMETQLSTRLFERTTRRVQLTEAGRDLQARVAPLLAQTTEIVRAFSQQQGLARPELRVGISRSIGLAYLPGFFHAYERSHPQVLLNIGQDTSSTILRKVDEGALDAGIVHSAKPLARGLEFLRRFQDEFVLIAPKNLSLPLRPASLSLAAAMKLLKDQRWLTIDSAGSTGRLLNRWLTDRGWNIKPAMESDSFDLIVNLVALGTGVAFVPHRVLPIYQNRRVVQRVSLKDRFVRTLAVVMRKSRKRPEHLKAFVDEFLF